MVYGENTQKINSFRQQFYLDFSPYTLRKKAKRYRGGKLFLFLFQKYFEIPPIEDIFVFIIGCDNKKIACRASRQEEVIERSSLTTCSFCA